MAALRAQRRVAGLCEDCGARAPVKGHVLCAECRGREAAQTKDRSAAGYYLQKDRARYKSARGTACKRCGAVLASTSLIYCAPHLEEHRAYERRRKGRLRLRAAAWKRLTSGCHA